MCWTKTHPLINLRVGRITLGGSPSFTAVQRVYVHYTGLDLPWKTFPMWRVGIELRRILVKADFNISVLTRLASEFNEDIERSEIPRDLLSLPLPKMSDEQEVDKAIRDFDDMDFVASHVVQNLVVVGYRKLDDGYPGVIQFPSHGKGSAVQCLGHWHRRAE